MKLVRTRAGCLVSSFRVRALARGAGRDASNPDIRPEYHTKCAELLQYSPLTSEFALGCDILNLPSSPTRSFPLA